MAGYSARSDKLWQFAAQLFEEEAKSIQFAQQEEEHGKRIKIKFNQIVSNLSCLGDIIATMFEKDKLTQKEFEQIRHLQPTPIRANEELLSIIARKPRDVYECFLSLIKRTNQLHLYQMLVSGDDTASRDVLYYEERRLLELRYLDNHVIGKNYQCLVENIKSSPLIDLLHEKKCITDEERDDLSYQPDDYFKNDALLQWMRTISFNEEKGQKVLECLRQTEQNLIADSLEKGGAFIKSKIWTKLLNEQQQYNSFAKSSVTNAEGLKEMEAMTINRLNQSQGLPLFSIQNATSEIADDHIVIAPYCHRETSGIVIWFWCQKKDDKYYLKNDYESGDLLQELITIFKEFFNDSASSVSEILVPIHIIFAEDHRWNADISGLAVLGQEVFISRKNSEVEVYDSMTFRLKRRMEVDGMTKPENLASCSVNNCLYAFDWNYQEHNQRPAVLRIDPTNGNLIKTWNIDGHGGPLSVASDTNVILIMEYEDKLHEYTADGELIRMIDLDSERSGKFKARHALKLDNSQFVVCDGGGGDPLRRVCLLSVKSTTNTMGRTEEVKIIQTSFGEERKESLNILMGPSYLSVDKEGSILVSDDSDQTVLLSSNLDEPQIIVSREHELQLSWRTCFDELTGQWFVTDYQRVMVCRVKDKQVERKRYSLLSY